ncbi:hypothetical protein Tco_0188605 [Tanacetum coccineum]
MSNLEDSTVTYTAVSSPFGGLLDIGSPGVDGPPMMPEDPYAYVVAAFQALPSPDYVPCPEYPPSSEFVPKPVYPEFMPPEDDVLPTEEQPLVAAVSPTADSPRYISESDLEEDPEDDDDDDEEEEDPFGDEVDDEEEDEDNEEEEHPALGDFIPPPVHRVTARISIQAQTPISLLSDTEVARLLAIPTPPPLLLSPWSSPLPQIPSSPLPLILSPLLVSPPLPISPPPLPASPTYPLGYRAAMIRLRSETPSTSHPLKLPPPIVLLHTRASVAMMKAAAPSTYILAPRSGILPSETPPLGTPPLLPLPTPSPPLLLPSTDYRASVSEVTLSPWKRLCIALGLRYEVSESSSAPTARPTRGCRADYGFVGTLDDEIRRDPERYFGYGIINTWEDMVEDVQGSPVDDRLLMSSRLNTPFRDRRAHAHTALLMEREARLSCEAWGRSMDASDLAHSEVMALCTQVVAQQSKIASLQAADRARQVQLVETLRLMSTLQTQVTAGTRWRSSTARDTGGGR